jgi:hypothetical protein
LKYLFIKDFAKTRRRKKDFPFFVKKISLINNTENELDAEEKKYWITFDEHETSGRGDIMYQRRAGMKRR